MISSVPHAVSIHWRPFLISSSISSVVALAIIITIGSGAATGILYPFIGQQAFIALSGAGVGITSLLLLIPIIIISVITRRKSTPPPPALPGNGNGGGNIGGGIGHFGGGGGNFGGNGGVSGFGVGNGRVPQNNLASSSSESEREGEERRPVRRPSHQPARRLSSLYEEYDAAKWGEADSSLRGGFQHYDEALWNAAIASQETTPSNAEKAAKEAAATISLHQIHAVSLAGKTVRIGEYHCLSGLVFYHNIGTLSDAEAKKPPRILSEGEEATLDCLNIFFDDEEKNEVKRAILMSDFRLYDLSTENGVKTDYDTLQKELLGQAIGNNPYRQAFSQQDKETFQAVKQHLGLT